MTIQIYIFKKNVVNKKPIKLNILSSEIHERRRIQEISQKKG